MAALVVPSRFAGLKIEDDDYPSSSDSQKSKKTNKLHTARKPEPNKKMKNNTNTKPQHPPGQKKKRSKQNNTSDEQWEIWKQKDEELIDGNFENEMQQAILLSKLDFEEKREVNKSGKKGGDVEKKSQEQNNKGNNKKQKKKNVMSLDQFNDLMNSGEDHNKFNHIDEKNAAETKSPVDPKDTEFFVRVKNDTKNELLKDKIIDRVKNRLTASDEVVNRVQFADALEKKDKEIAALKQEVLSLKDELFMVKSRNKKLCNILGQGEMKDKAEVLMEVERLRAVQTELTAELALLHTDLEKERSKNTDPRAKDKKYSTTKKKNIRFDVSSEAMITKESSSGTG